MDLTSMKQLEDLKMIRNSLGQELGQKLKVKKEQYIQTIRSDFADFFRKQGFKIENQTLSITATYNELTACLSHKDPETSYLGYYFILNLDFKTFNNKNYTILLGRSEPSISVSVSSSGPQDSNIQKEIESIQRSIEETKNRLEKFPQEEWKLIIKIDDSSQRNPTVGTFDSMREFLKSLME